MEFKVGDRVLERCTGDKGTVASERSNTREDEIPIKWDDDVRYVGGKIVGTFPDRLTLITPPDTVTIGSKTYTKLKSLSPQQIYDEHGVQGTCKEWKQEFHQYSFNFGFYTEPALRDVIDSCEAAHPKWLPWLLSHGYIGVEEKKKEKKVVVIEEVNWVRGKECGAFPTGDVTTHAGWVGFVGKPPMKMTLEWVE
jgi:hypothetical protein